GYRVTDLGGEETTSTVTVAYQPDARDDVSTGNPAGDPVSVDVTGNDHDDVDPTTVRLIDPATGDPVLTLVGPGEGPWPAAPATAVATFPPEPGFPGAPTPVRYTALDGDGFEVTATITIGYLPAALGATGMETLPLILLALLLLLGGGAAGLIGVRRRHR